MPFRSPAGCATGNLESYLKRLERLESIANSFSGVEKVYAVQAGREIRIMVKPEKIDDATAMLTARKLRRRSKKNWNIPDRLRLP